MKTKYLIYLLVIAVLGGAAWYLSKKKSTTPLTATHEVFAVLDMNEIGKVFIADRQGRQVLLEQKGDEWFVTNKVTGKTYLADINNINLLKTSINQLRVRMPVNNSAEKEVVKNLAAKGVKIEVYNTSGKKIRGFYVGMLMPNEVGSAGIMENSEQPYVLYMPNIQGEILPRFSAVEGNYRDKAALRIKMEQTKSLSLEYNHPTQKQLSFKIEGISGSPKVMPLAAATLPDKELDELYLGDYLGLMSKGLYCESFITNDPLRDSLLMFSPLFATFNVEKKDGSSYNLKLLKLGEAGTRRSDTGGGTIRGTTSRYLGVVNNGEELMLIQNNPNKKFFVAYPYFFGKMMSIDANQ